MRRENKTKFSTPPPQPTPTFRFNIDFNQQLTSFASDDYFNNLIDFLLIRKRILECCADDVGRVLAT